MANEKKKLLSFDADLALTGNLTVKGTTISENVSDLLVKDALIVANADGTDVATTLVGTVYRISETEAYAIAYDTTNDSVHLGKGTYDTDTKTFAFAEGEGRPVAVRADSADIQDGHLLAWDAETFSLVSAGKKIDELNPTTENVILAKDIKLAGDFDKVGNLAKGETLTAGTSLQSVLQNILQQRLQPSVTNPTAVITATGSQDAYEVGTEYTLPTATLKVTTGSYTYGPATGVKFTAGESKLVFGANPDAEGAVKSVNSADLGNNDTITLAPAAYNNNVTKATFTDTDVSYTFSAKATHTAGAVALDNLDTESSPVKQISAATIEATDATAKFRGFRYMFAGGTTATTVDSAAIRALATKREHTKKPTTSNYFEFTAAKGSTKVVFAFPAGRMSNVSSPKFQIFTMAWGDTSGFVKSTVDVADASGTNAYSYDVYTYTPATPLAADSTKYRVYF